MILDFRFWILDFARKCEHENGRSIRNPQSAIRNRFNQKSKIQNLSLGLIGGLILMAAPLSARTPEQADMLYHDIGSQLFCVCKGCREGLLVCSMNNCSAKVAQRDFLGELCKDDKLDSAGIKAAMVERFGPQVLQVPAESSLYSILALAGLLLAGAFGFGFWAVSRRAAGKTENAATPDAEEDSDIMDSRIERDLKELE